MVVSWWIVAFLPSVCMCTFLAKIDEKWEACYHTGWHDDGGRMLEWYVTLPLRIVIEYSFESG